MSDLPSPSVSGKLRAKAILKPPRRPPQVMIIAVFFSKVLKNDRILIGINTPIPLDKTTTIIVITERIR